MKSILVLILHPVVRDVLENGDVSDDEVDNFLKVSVRSFYNGSLGRIQ